MPHFRKKPVTIEARKFVKGKLTAVAKWCGGQIFTDEGSRHIVDMVIETLEGEMTVNIGDWVIKGVEGEFYPCKPSIFEKTYEAV